MSHEKIMIVEENLLIATELADTLVGRGYDIVGVVSSRENAVSMAKHMHLDLILLDTTLNDTFDGVMIASEIRSQTDRPIIYMSQYPDEELINRSRCIPPYGFLLKPIDERNLLAIIKRALIWDSWGKISIDNISQYYYLYQDTPSPMGMDTSTSMMGDEKTGTRMRNVGEAA